MAYHPATQAHSVRFDDGIAEDIVLAFEEWVLLDSAQQQLGLAAEASAQPAASGAWGEGQAEGQPQAELEAGPPPKRARTPSLLGAPAARELEPASAVQLDQLLLEAGVVPQGPAGSSEAAAAAAQLEPPPAPSQQHWLQQTQQEFLPSSVGGLLLPSMSLPLGTPPPLPLFGAGPPAPAGQPEPPVVMAAPIGEAAAPSEAAAPPKPQELVATGRNYRVFTAQAPPAGFELFCLLPGFSIAEVRGRMRGCESDLGTRQLRHGRICGQDGWWPGVQRFRGATPDAWP